MALQLLGATFCSPLKKLSLLRWKFSVLGGFVESWETFYVLAPLAVSDASVNTACLASVLKRSREMDLTKFTALTNVLTTTQV